MISNRELVKAGKVPLRVIGSWNVDLTTYGPVSPTSDLFATLARKSVYRARIQRYKPQTDADREYWPRRNVEPLTLAQMNDILGMIGQEGVR